jgi:hypothetical protein
MTRWCEVFVWHALTNGKGVADRRSATRRRGRTGSVAGVGLPPKSVVLGVNVVGNPPPDHVSIRGQVATALALRFDVLPAT